MRITCPSCGATNSLDSLLAHTDAGDAVRAALSLLPDGLGNSLLRYCSLWRSQGRTLAWAKVAKILNDLSPDIQRQMIRRQSREFPAPPQAWVTAINLALVAQSEGNLKTPLNSHGWLYTVISSLKPEQYQADTPVRTDSLRREQPKIVLSPLQQKMQDAVEAKVREIHAARNANQNQTKE